MKYRFDHSCFPVKNIETSLKFYKDALGLTERQKFNFPDGSTSYHLSDGSGSFHALCLLPQTKPAQLSSGGVPFHLGVTVEGFEESHKKHKEMNCVAFDDPKPLGFYFITDPDGNWINVIDASRKSFNR